MTQSFEIIQITCIGKSLKHKSRYIEVSFRSIEEARIVLNPNSANFEVNGLCKNTIFLQNIKMGNLKAFPETSKMVVIKDHHRKKIHQVLKWHYYSNMQWSRKQIKTN